MFVEMMKYCFISAADTSAPESGRTAMDVVPFQVVMLTTILGAGSDAATLLIFERSRSWLIDTVLVDAVSVGLGSGNEGLLQHTLAK